MKRLQQLLTLLLLFISTVSYAQIENPVSWSKSLEKISDTQYKIVFRGIISSPWSIYDTQEYVGGPNPTTITMDELPEGIALDGGVVVLSPVKKAFDEMFSMEIGKLYHEAILEQALTVEVSNAKISGYIEWQACDDTSCIAPTDERFEFTIGAEAVAVAPAAVVTEATEKVEVSAPATSSGSGKSLWSVIIEAVLWGFAALLTPCVFPMVPMTVSFFMKSEGTKAKGRMMAAIYGVSIVLLYTLPIAVIIALTYFLGGDAVTADIFNWLATHWLPNILFFVIFMVFAISFFGAFEIVLPSWLVNKSDAKSDKGGIIGVFFMALTLVLVSFSCTGPIVGSILVSSTQGAVWQPIITMLAFSTAFALPFTLFAFFPSMLKNLPKSGGWLNSVKVVLGFIELALGLKFLSVADQTYHWGLLDREVYIAIWIVIFFMLGLYLLGKIQFAHDTPEPYLKVKKLFMAIVSFAFVVYLIPGMFGAPLKALSGYLPPMHTHDFNLLENRGSYSTSSSSDITNVKYGEILHLPHGLEGFFDFEEASAYAEKVGKPLFVDFTGHGCVNCREMEANVWSDKEVLSILREEYVIVALYVDDKLTLPESDWVTAPNGRILKSLGKINAQYQITEFGINAQPYYVIMDNDDNILITPRGYDLSISGFVEFLKSGVEAYNKEK